MLAATNAPSPSVDRRDGPQRAVMRPIGSHYGVSVKKNQTERLKLDMDFLQAYNHRGTVVVASVWLVLYAIMSIGDLAASLN